MISLKLTSDWDLMLDDMGNLATISGGIETAQAVATSCRVWRGEMIYDTTRGVPYKSEVFGVVPNFSMIETYLENEAKRIENVNSITVNMDSFNNRRLTPDIQVTLKSGEGYNV